MKIHNKQQVRNISKAIVDHYLSTDVPPPNKVIVNPGSISISNDRNWFKASVRTEVCWTNNTVKTHTVNIRFKLQPNNKLDSRTIAYL